MCQNGGGICWGGGVGREETLGNNKRGLKKEKSYTLKTKEQNFRKGKIPGLLAAKKKGPGLKRALHTRGKVLSLQIGNFYDKL